MQVRLLMCYVATHPEKMDDTKAGQWQKLAKLSTQDMETITNLEYLGVPVRKRGKTPALMFGRKRKRAVRKVCSGLPYCNMILLCSSIRFAGFWEYFQNSSCAAMASAWWIAFKHCHLAQRPVFCARPLDAFIFGCKRKRAVCKVEICLPCCFGFDLLISLQIQYTLSRGICCFMTSNQHTQEQSGVRKSYREDAEAQRCSGDMWLFSPALE